MGSIPIGPVIEFRFSQPSLQGSTIPALQQVREQAKTVSNQIADDWKRMAAQIRTSMAQGLGPEKEIVSARTQLISLLDKELSGLRTRNELTVKELSSLKAMTLERERQANAIKTGTVGVTAGTNAALGQVSQQTVLGVGRILDSLVNRYLGGAAGAAFRTARDVQYYSNQAGGIAGSGGGILSGLGAIASAIPDSVLAVGGLTAAFAALATVGITVTKSLADTAQAINNTAAATGLSTTQVQIYDRLAKEMDIDSGSLTNAFARLQAQIGEFVTKGKTADDSTQNFIRVLTQFGISVKDSSGHLRNINDIISDFANVVQALPDKNAAAALTLEAFGTRGKILAQIINQATVEGRTFKQVMEEIGQSNIVIPDAQIQNLQKAKTAWEELWRAAAGEGTVLKESIASAFLKGTGIQGILDNAPGPQNAQAQALAALRSGQRQLSGGESFFIGDPAQAKAQIEAILKGDERAAQIEDLRKQATEELAHGNYNVALSLAQQAESLKAALDLDKQRTAELEKSLKLYQDFGLSPSRGSLESGREARSVQDLRNRLLNPGAGGAPDIGIGSGPSTTDLLKGIVGPAGKAPLNAADLLAQINKEHEDLFRSQASIDAEHYQDELDSLNEAHKKLLISEQEYNEAVKELNADRNKTLEDANKKYEDEAGSLFEDLISGKGKNFSQALLKDVENIALSPVKKIFDAIIGGQLKALSDLFSGKKPGGIWGTITGKIGGVIGPGGTPGWWPGAIGGGPSGGVGQTGVSTQVMNVTAQVVNILSAAAAGGGAGGGLGNFFGPTSLLGGFGNFFGNLNPFGGSGFIATGAQAGASGNVSLLTKVLGQAGPLAAGAATLGLGLATGNESTMAIGAATLASRVATTLSGVSQLPAGLTSALGTAGLALPGIGIAASGIITAGQSRSVGGQIGGTLEAGLGGALAGTAILPGIGTAVGAIAGLVGGALSSIFGGGPQGFQQSVQYAMVHQQYHAPLSENFSFASNGSIANTLGTGFFQSGSRFSQYALPANTSFAASALTGDLTWQQLYQLQNSGLNPNAPFLGNPSTNPYVGQGPVGVHATSSPNVNVTVAIPGLVDANQIASTLAPHITSIAQMVTKQVTNSSSGFGSNVRRAAYLP